jgi:hypothetical protein
MTWWFRFIIDYISSQIRNGRFLRDEIDVIVKKKVCKGFGNAITAALIRSCPIIPKKQEKR